MADTPTETDLFEALSTMANDELNAAEDTTIAIVSAPLIPDATPILPDLIEYFLDMISPPGERALFLGDLSYLSLDKMKGWVSNSIPGILVRGQPNEEQSKEFLRALRPGAHFLLIAPDEEPTGDTGACTIEDNGFEIRDAILLVDKPGLFHYIPKASREERERGCDQLPGKTTVVSPEEQAEWLKLSTDDTGGTRDRSDLTEDEQARYDALKVKIEASQEGTIHNFHPTVKPTELMERLLRDVPKGPKPVVDPFNGSGSTGRACLNTGHNYLGIDREAEYITISTARADEGKRSTKGDRATQIEVVANPPDLRIPWVDDHGSQKLLKAAGLDASMAGTAEALIEMAANTPDKKKKGGGRKIKEAGPLKENKEASDDHALDMPWAEG